jgi:hypothetical protein
VKFILHIGQSKTGTSAIQSFLSLNYYRLLKYGFLFPRNKVNGMVIDLNNHNTFADSVAGKLVYPYMEANQYLENIKNEAEQNNIRKIILSAEHFIGGQPRVWDVRDPIKFFEKYENKISTLKELLTGHEIEIIAFLRPQVDWMASTISQNVKISRLISDTNVYESDNQFFELFKPLLKYRKLLNIWDQKMKPSRIITVPYDQNSMFKGSSIETFINSLEIEENGPRFLRDKQKINRSISWEFTEVKKIINRSKKSKARERAIIACLKNLSAGLDNYRPYNIDNDLAIKIARYVNSDNEKLNKEYMKGGTKLNSTSSDPPIIHNYLVTKNQTKEHYEIFKREFRKPQYRWMIASNIAKELLRNHARPIHSLLHQIKRF